MRTDLPSIQREVMRALVLTNCAGVADMAGELIHVREELKTLRASHAALLAALKTIECQVCGRHFIDAPSPHRCSFCAPIREAVAHAEAVRDGDTR